MLDRDDLNLIQRHIDGELTPEETVRLEGLLARSPEARRLASDLAALSNGLEQGDMIDPPAEAVAEIMSRVSGLPRPRRQEGFVAALRALPARASVAFREISGLAAGADSRMEDVMSRRAKLVFGLSAAAVVVLIGVYLGGYYPPVEEGAATIGAAKRYQAQQMAASDVKLGDQAAQKFMQSDTFDRILRDPHARKMLSNGKLQEFFADPQIAPAFKHSEFGAALQQIATDANLTKVFSDPEMAQAIGNNDVAAALVDPEMINAFKDELVEAALNDPDIRDGFADAALDVLFANDTLMDAFAENHIQTALASEEFRNALAKGVDFDGKFSSTALENAFKDQTLQDALNDAGIDAALADADFLEMIAQPEFAALFDSQAFLALLDDDSVRNAFMSPELMNAFSEAGIVAALQGAAVSGALADADIVTALNDAEMSNALADAATVTAFGSPDMVALMSGAEFATAMQSQDMLAAFKDPGFALALQSSAFDVAMAKASEQ